MVRNYPTAFYLDFGLISTQKHKSDLVNAWTNSCGGSTPSSWRAGDLSQSLCVPHKTKNQPVLPMNWNQAKSATTGTKLELTKPLRIQTACRSHLIVPCGFHEDSPVVTKTQEPGHEVQPPSRAANPPWDRAAQ